MSIRTYFENIADAIREKGGTSDALTPEEMPQAILDLPSGGGTITELQGIRTNYVQGAYIDSRFVYTPQDTIKIYIKNLASPASYGNWPVIMTRASGASNSPVLAYNLWNGRKVINARYDGQYSGDGALSYSDPYDYQNIYCFELAKNIFNIYKGATFDDLTLTVNLNFSASASTAEVNDLRFFDTTITSNRTDCIFYKAEQYRNGVLIDTLTFRRIELGVLTLLASHNTAIDDDAIITFPYIAVE